MPVEIDDNSKPWTRADEENLLLDISEDRRLQRLGIDPDQSTAAIYLELLTRKKKLEAERRNKHSSPPTS